MPTLPTAACTPTYLCSVKLPLFTSSLKNSVFGFKLFSWLWLKPWVLPRILSILSILLIHYFYYTDTPPADYVAPSQLLAQQQQEQLNAQGSQQTQQGQNQGSRGQAQGTRTQGVRVQTQGVQTQANRNNQQQQGGNRQAGRAGGVAVTQNQGGQQGQQNADANEQEGVDQSAQQSSGRAFAVGGAKADSSNTGTLQITSSDQNEQQQ